jgi:hypothetical protein
VLLADVVGIAASSRRIPRFGRRPHQVAYAVCLASTARRVLDSRARHADAIAQLALLAAMAGTQGGSRPHRVIALAASATALGATVRLRRASRARPVQPSANWS